MPKKNGFFFLNNGLFATFHHQQLTLFSLTHPLIEPKAMVLLTKSYGFVHQKLWFCSTKAMVLLSKSYGFAQQKLWFGSTGILSESMVGFLETGGQSFYSVHGRGYSVGTPLPSRQLRGGSNWGVKRRWGEALLEDDVRLRTSSPLPVRAGFKRGAAAPSCTGNIDCESEHATLRHCRSI